MCRVASHAEIDMCISRFPMAQKYFVCPYLPVLVCSLVSCVMAQDFSACVLGAAADTCREGDNIAARSSHEVPRLYAIFGAEVILHSFDTFNRVHPSVKPLTGRRTVVAVCSAAMIMLQELQRVSAQCRRGAVRNICWRIDWLGGQSEQFVRHDKWRVFIKSCFYVCVVGYCFSFF